MITHQTLFYCIRALGSSRGSGFIFRLQRESVKTKWGEKALEKKRKTHDI